MTPQQENNLPTVSGGKDNPPDRYLVIDIHNTSDLQAGAEISHWADAQNGGFRVIAFSDGRVIMGNYKE